MAFRTDRHKVFVSFHEEDIRYKENFVRMMGKRIVDRSVDTGNIDDTGLKTTTVRQKIRDEYIRDTTVTIVLIGPRTWQRKHVDWEISASIIERPSNPRCGLLGLLLPTHSDYRKDAQDRNPRLIPPRLARNIEGNNPFAVIYDWPKNGISRKVLPKIHEAYRRRNNPPWPDNGLDLFRDNRRGDCLRGWQN